MYTWGLVSLWSAKPGAGDGWRRALKRTNFYVDDERLEALKHVATTEQVSVSDLVREGIDRVIRERMRGKPDRAALRADLQAYLEKYAGTGSKRSPRENERRISVVNGKRFGK